MTDRLPIEGGRADPHPVDDSPKPWHPTAVPTPTYKRHGAAQVSYLPGHEFAEVEFAVRGWRTPCTAVEARDLAYALLDALDGELAETRLAAHRAANLQPVPHPTEVRALLGDDL